MKLSFSTIAWATMLASVKFATATTYTIGFDPAEVGQTTIGAFPIDAYADKGISSITCEDVAPNANFDPPPVPQCAFKGSVNGGEIANANRVIYEFCGPTDIASIALWSRYPVMNGVQITYQLDVSCFLRTTP